MKSLLLAALLLTALKPSLADAATFKGYQCETPDCSGHIAGYNWAQRKRITDPALCTGNSRAFIEGCQAYARGL